MKIKHLIVISTVFAVASGLTGCSVVEKVKRVFVPENEYQSVVASGNNEQSIETPTAVIEEIKETSQQANHAPVKRTRLSDKNLEGEWAVVSVYGQRINLPTLPYVVFNRKSGKIYCSTGCNVMNADYMVTRNGGLSFDNLIASDRDCRGDKYDEHIEKALSRAIGYRYAKHSGTLYLNITDKKGNTILTLKQHNLNALNGLWSVQKIGNKSVAGAGMRLVIDIQSERIHGNSGCNIINGKVVFDSKKTNAVQFSNIISTRKACKDISLETDLLVALEETEYYSVMPDGVVDFTDNKGRTVLILKQMDRSTQSR